MPTASTATSAPKPSVCCRIISAACSGGAEITVSAPNCLAASSRAGATSTAMICAGLNSLAVVMVASPMGPAPTTTTVVAGRHAAVQDSDLVGGRHDVGQHQCVLIRH